MFKVVLIINILIYNNVHDVANDFKDQNRIHKYKENSVKNLKEKGQYLEVKLNNINLNCISQKKLIKYMDIV